MSKGLRKDLASLGAYIIGIITLIPIILWAFVAKINPPFSSIGAFNASLGDITGLIGIVLFSLGLILSVRLSFAERLFYGLNNVYTKHSKIGQIVLY